MRNGGYCPCASSVIGTEEVDAGCVESYNDPGKGEILRGSRVVWWTWKVWRRGWRGGWMRYWGWRRGYSGVSLMCL